MDSFGRTFGIVKIFIIVVFLLIFLSVIFKITMIADAKKNNKPIYQIDVNSYNLSESYTTTSYTKDKGTNCISFKDEFGVKHIVCNNYTITEY